MSIWKFDSTDFLNVLLESKAVERIDPKTRENLDTIFELAVNAVKEATLLVDGSFEGSRIGDSPVRADRLPGPHRALLGRRLVADHKNKIEARAVRRGELVPTLRAQTPGFVVQLVEQLERQRMYRARGMAPGAEASESPSAPAIDGALAHHAAR
jgi:hypothetical protein